MREQIKRIPILGNLARRLYRLLRGRQQESFPGSKQYWEQRYVSGGDSGVGSYDKFAHFKAEVINAFVSDNEIETVIELGCGDGNQLSLATYPKYIGFDVSQTAIDRCRQLYASDSSKTFKLMKDLDGETADLSLSLDVIYHLVEDEVFESYMLGLFEASDQHVIIYSSNTENDKGQGDVHVRHR